MNKFKSFFSLLLLCSAALINADCSNVCGNDNAGIRSIILPRSQGANTAMELVGWQDFIHQCDVDCLNVVGDFRFEYSRTFRPERIAEQLFGASTLHFQGSNVKAGLVAGSTARPDALLADYFGLSTNFDGAICFRPRIDNIIADFNFFIGLDNWLCGLYFEAHLPIVHTRWTLFDHCNTTTENDCCAIPGAPVISNPCSSSSACLPIQSNGSTIAFSGGYMNSGAQGVVPPAVAAAPDLMTALSGKFLFGDMKTPWIGGIISQARFNETRLADIELQLGWDFWKDEAYHLGAFLEFVCPTGGQQHYRGNVFGPIVGNGGYFELGAGMSGHYDLWQCNEHSFSLWMYGNVTHGFKKWQTRTFDFNNGPFSRYELLKEINADGSYAGNLISAVNYTTRRVQANIRVKGDASFKLAYNYCGFRFDLGYNIYGDSGERCGKNKNSCNPTTGVVAANATTNNCCLNSCGLDASRNFALKGCQPVSALGFTTVTVGDVTSLGVFDTALVPNPIPVNASANNSTAFSCGSIDNGVNIVLPGTDVALAYNSLQVGQISPVLTPGIIFAQNSIVNGELSPTLVSLANINVNSGLARSQITHKIFGYAGYNWMESCYTPFVGFLWEVEFAQGSGRKNKCNQNGTSTTTNTCCGVNTCDFNGPIVNFAVSGANGTDCSSNKHRGGVSLWGIGIKVGITY